MKKAIITLIIVAVLIAAFFLLKPYYVLEKGKQAVIVRFGDVIKTEKVAGFHLKIPIIDEVKLFSDKILSWNGRNTEMPTKEAKYILVDTTARWRISDIELFYGKLKSMEEAYSRLDKIIDSRIKNIIAQNNLSEAVRNTNSILNYPGPFTLEQLETDLLGKISENADKLFVKGLYIQDENGLFSINKILNTTDGLVESQQFWKLITEMDYKPTADTTSSTVDLIRKNYDTTSNTLESVEKGRKQIADEIAVEVKKALPEFGIELIDIVIRQIRYTDDLKPAVFDRMIQERRQLAQAFRSYGQGQKAELLGQMNAEESVIISKAYADAEEKKGAADATAITTYADAYRNDQEFYEFWRSMESYKNVIPNENVEMTLTTDIEYFKYMTNPKGK